MIGYPDQPTLASWIEHARHMYHEELGRLPDPSGLANWIGMAAAGQTGDQILAWMRTTPEWHAHHDAPPVVARPPVDINAWAGAFCIPDAFTSIPYGDGRRIWTPALLCYDDIDRDRIYTALTARGYTHVPILLSGRPYGDMYPTIPFSALLASFIIHEMQARGFVPVLAFDDARGPDCSYLQPLADLTQSGPLVIMGPYEINDDQRDADLRSILVQKFALWPHAVQAVHFTPGHGSGGGPNEWEWWQWAHDVAGIRVHLAQEAWFDDPRMSGIGMEDNARRLVGDVGGTVPPAWSPMQSRPIQTVRFEQTTSRTLHGSMTEIEAVAFDNVARLYCPHTIGFCDGGTP